MDALRVRAYLDALLGQDTAARYQTTPSQPGNDSPGTRHGDGPHGESGTPAGNRTSGDSTAPQQPSGTGPDGPPPAPIRPAAKINLTIVNRSSYAWSDGYSALSRSSRLARACTRLHALGPHTR